MQREISGKNLIVFLFVCNGNSYKRDYSFSRDLGGGRELETKNPLLEANICYKHLFGWSSNYDLNKWWKRLSLLVALLVVIQLTGMTHT